MFATPTSRFCQSCGSGLEPSGECNVCLLQLGISQSGAEDSPPVHAALPSLEELNAQFPQLEITRLIGHGGMGAIYHARQTTLDRDVALKLIRKEVSSDAAFVERFEREAKTLAKLSHPHIVTIFDYGRTPDGIAYLIMEYVDGINLRDAISSGSVGSDEALEVVSTICRALKYAHSKGVVHRDIKPENILLGEDGTLKVVDFGIAKIVDESVRTPTLTATRQVLGSLHYLAPEHLEAPHEVDHRVDLYALGVVFYELLTGQLPLGRYEAPSRIHNRVDQRLDAIVLKTLSRKPTQRYQTAAELDSDIDEIRTSGSAAENRQAEEIKPHAEPAGGRSVSVPFTCEALGGLAEAVGVLHARQNVLCAEFRIRDSIWGHVKSQTHILEIPQRNLTRLELVPGIFSSRMVLTADTISALGDLPNAETGRVALKINRKDEEYGHEVVRALGFDEGPRATIADASALKTNQPADANRVLFALLMIICGGVNAGGLAISEAFIAQELSDIEFFAASISSAVILGPIALLQLLTGVFNLFGRPGSLNLAAVIISMLPVTPVWIVSFPTAIWALRCIRRDPPVHADRSHVKKNFGTTTLMFIRESRWARIVGVLNAVGAVLILLAFGIFKFGYYPVELRYRVVGRDVDYHALDKAMQTRLQALSDGRGIEYDDLSQPARLTITTLQRCRRQVEELLAVQEIPQLVWIASTSIELTKPESAEGSFANEEASQMIPVLSGMDMSSFQVEKHSLGTAVRAATETFELSDDFVRRVSAGDREGEKRLVVELTSRGREELDAQLLEQGTAGGLGLVIGGLVEGLAKMEAISHKQIVFELSSASDLTSNGIAAGIRGPNIPTELEPLD